MSPRSLPHARPMATERPRKTRSTHEARIRVAAPQTCAFEKAQTATQAPSARPDRRRSRHEQVSAEPARKLSRSCFRRGEITTLLERRWNKGEKVKVTLAAGGMLPEVS